MEIRISDKLEWLGRAHRSFWVTISPKKTSSHQLATSKREEAKLCLTVMSSASGKKRAAGDDDSASSKKAPRGKKVSLLNQHLCWMGKDQPWMDVIIANAVKKCIEEGIVSLYNCIMFAFYYFSYMLTEVLVDEDALARGEDMYQDATDEESHLPNNGKKACAKLVKTMHEAFSRLEDLEAEESIYELNKPIKLLKNITEKFHEKLNEKPAWSGNAALRGLILRKNKKDELIPLFTLDDKDSEPPKYSAMEKNDQNTAKCRAFFIKYLPEKEIKVDASNIVTLDGDMKNMMLKFDAMQQTILQQLPKNFHKKYARELESHKNRFKYLEAHIQFVYDELEGHKELLRLIAEKAGVKKADYMLHCPTDNEKVSYEDTQHVADAEEESEDELDHAELPEKLPGKSSIEVLQERIAALKAKSSSEGGSADMEEDEPPFIQAQM